MQPARLRAWTRMVRGSPFWLAPLLVLLCGVLAVPGDRRALAHMANTPAAIRIALPALVPATADTPSMRQDAVYPPPPSVPDAVSICGPLFSNTSVPTCQASGTTISVQKGGLAAYGLAISAGGRKGFPNLQRDITLSQEEASGLFVVLGHGRFDGLLGATQVVMLDAIVRRLGQVLQPGNAYRLEVDQKTGNLDFRYSLVGSAMFVYVP